MIYYVIFILLVIFGFFELFDIKKYYVKPLSYIAIFILILLAGLRWECWTDWDNYYAYYVNGNHMKYSFEIGYRIWETIVYFFSDNFNIFLIATYTILMLILLKSFKYENYYLLPFIPFYSSMFLYYSSSLRQFISTIILFYSIKFIINRNFYKFILLVFIAFLFHKSAIVFLISYIICRINFSNKKIVLLIFLALILKQFNFMEFIIEISMPIFEIISPMIANKLSIYLEMLVERESMFGIFRKTIMIISFCFIRNEANIFNKNYNIYFNVYLIGYISSLFIYGEFARLESHFYFAECILFAISLKCLGKNKYFINIYFIYVLMYLSILISRVIGAFSEFYLPYKSIFGV